jgi:hypothetical protein
VRRRFQSGKAVRVKYRRAWCICTILLALPAAWASGLAPLTSDAKVYLRNLDNLAQASHDISDARATMATHLTTAPLLQAAIQQFFTARQHAAQLAAFTTAQCKGLKREIGFKGAKFTKPAKGAGDLVQDATAYITHFDAWSALDTQVQVNLADVRVAVAGDDVPALTLALTSFFTDRHARFQMYLNLLGDIRALQKDVSFKTKSKPVKPTGLGLDALATAFLSDRAAWSTQEAQLGVTRDAIRTALSSATGVQDAVTAFLNARYQHGLQGRQVDLDRALLRALAKIKQKDCASSVFAPKDDNYADPLEQCEQSDSTAGG